MRRNCSDERNRGLLTRNPANHPTDDDAIRGRIENFVRCLIKAGHLVLQYKNEAYALRLDEYASKDEIEERSQFWHFFCELRIFREYEGNEGRPFSQKHRNRTHITWEKNNQRTS